MLTRLCDSATLYMDGTFATCPRLFYQIFTINIIVETQQFPALYALLPTKSRATHNRLFTIVKEELQNRNLELLPPRILTDFEVALLQSVELQFAGATISGCYFHYYHLQCLYRWINNSGYSRLY